MTPTQINELLKNAIELAYETEPSQASLFFTMGQLTAAVVQLQQETYRLNKELDEIIGEADTPSTTEELGKKLNIVVDDWLARQPSSDQPSALWAEAQLKRQETLETNDDDAGAAPGVDYVDPDGGKK
jgi:hypothetical protein